MGFVGNILTSLEAKNKVNFINTKLKKIRRTHNKHDKISVLFRRFPDLAIANSDCN